MITNHPTLSNAILVTFKNTKFVLGLKNKTLQDTTMFKHSGIPIHGKPVP
jgi:hypothetical protein